LHNGSLSQIWVSNYEAKFTDNYISLES